MNIPELESFLFEKMSATRIPGMSIALVKGDEVVYSRGFGQADIAKGIAVQPDTLFGAASITKSFCAISILQLVERGLLKLDDPVEKYLPLPMKWRDTVRLEHLLTHTTGLPAIGYIEGVLRHAHNVGGCNLPIGSTRDILTFMHGADDWVETEPGKRWFYLNEGYVMLGEIVGKVSGKPFEQYMRENILQPLGMSRSFFCEDDCNRDGKLAMPYVTPRSGAAHRPGRYLWGMMGADANLITNTLDLAKYVSMFLRRGKGVLSEASYQNMTTGRIDMAAQPASLLDGKQTSAKPAQYAIGVTVADFNGEPLIAHGGSLIFSTCWFGFLPKSGIGVALMTNGNGFLTVNMGKVALSTMLGKDVRKLNVVRTETAMNELAGHYETFKGTLKTKLVRRGDFLELHYLCGDQGPAAMICVPEVTEGNEPRFFTYQDGARVNIQFRKSNGNVEMVFERYKMKRTGPLQG